MDIVQDEELLFRRIRMNLGQHISYKVEPNRSIRLTTMAFSDRKGRPSVYRAAMLDNDASKVQEVSDNGVVNLITARVRESEVPSRPGGGPNETIHTLDVVAVPLENDPSHAEIISVPHLPPGKNGYERMLERLAQISTWVIYPADIRS